MSPDVLCEQVRDAILTREPLAPDLASHLAACPSCREIRRGVDALRLRGSAFPVPPPPTLVDRILSCTDAEKQQFEPSSPIPRWFSRPAVLGLGTAVLAIVLVLGTWLGNRLAAPSYRFWEGSLAVMVRPLSVPINLGARSGRVDSPDGSSLELAGPLTMQVLERGFFLERGTVIATVQPGPGTFTVTTPHGKVEVLGTVFSCHVASGATHVAVITGTVRTTSPGQPPLELIAGESRDMVYSARPSRNSGEQPRREPGTDLATAPAVASGPFRREDVSPDHD